MAFIHSVFSPSAALPAPWERQEVHLAPCPCGADHVAWTVLRHFYPGVGRIWNCPGRYLLIKIWSKLKKKLCGSFQLWSVEWNVYFLCVSLFFFSLSLLDSFHQRPDCRSRWWVDRILLLCPKTVVLKFAEITVKLTLLFCANVSYLWGSVIVTFTRSSCNCSFSIHHWNTIISLSREYMGSIQYVTYMMTFKQLPQAQIQHFTGPHRRQHLI